LEQVLAGAGVLFLTWLAASIRTQRLDAPAVTADARPAMDAGSEHKVTRRRAGTAEQGGAALYSRDSALRQARSPACRRRPWHSCSSNPDVSPE
jgi:hypothetical protein